MSYAVPDLFGPAHKWLTTADPATVTEQQFRSALDNYIQHAIKSGVDPDQFMDPDVFFQPGDLQLYENIRSTWSTVPKGKHCPGLDQMLMAVKPVSGARTFRQDIEQQYQLFRKWCADARLDPDKLDESKEERERRLARERMRNKRLRDAESDIKDPDEMALVRLLRASKENARAGHAWFKAVERDAKSAYDAAVDAAKLQRTHTVSTARGHIIAADQAVADAQLALDLYRSNK